jgi:hypothetical protein
VLIRHNRLIFHRPNIFLKWVCQSKDLVDAVTKHSDCTFRWHCRLCFEVMELVVKDRVRLCLRERDIKRSWERVSERKMLRGLGRERVRARERDIYKKRE